MKKKIPVKRRLTGWLKALPFTFVELILCVFLAFPFLFVLSTSLKSQQDYFRDPVSLFSSFTLENYKMSFEMGIAHYFLNSLLVVVISIVLLVFLSTMSSYALSRIDFKVNKFISLLLVSGMMLPIHASLIPVFVLENKVGIYDTLMGLVLPQLAFAIPISVFIASQFLDTIPPSLLEAAKVDGANHYQMFFQVVLPLLRPAIVTIVIYNGVRIWNNFSFALVFTQSKQNYTIPLGLQEFYGEFSVNVPGILSAITISTLPILIIYFLMQDTVIKGLTGGAVKE